MVLSSAKNFVKIFFLPKSKILKSCVYFENSQRCSVTSCTHQSVWQPNYSPFCASNKPLLRCHPSSFTSCVSLEQQAPPLLSPSIIHFLCLLNNNIWHRKWSHLLFCHTPDGYMHNTNISEKFQRLKQKKYFFVIYREGIFASRAQRSEGRSSQIKRYKITNLS